MQPWLDRMRLVVCSGCGDTLELPPRRPQESPIPQRVPPMVATMSPAPDRNRRNRMRTWSLIADMSLLARYFPAIEGRAQSIEPSVQNGGARDENDKRMREMATAVLIHQRWKQLAATTEGRMHAAVIEFALIQRDGSKLADDDDKTTPVAAKARELAFERIALAFATKAQREAWQRSKARSLTQQAMRKIGRRLFTAARDAYEGAA
jgi:hypothetical protein